MTYSYVTEIDKVLIFPIIALSHRVIVSRMCEMTFIDSLDVSLARYCFVLLDVTSNPRIDLSSKPNPNSTGPGTGLAELQATRGNTSHLTAISVCLNRWFRC